MLFTQEKIRSLNPIEFDIYDYIQKNPDKIHQLKIRELASELHVSTATILRFCKKLGCSGYAEFKFKLKEGLPFSKEVDALNTIAKPDDYFQLRADDAADLEQQINDVVMLMRSADRVIFIGEGSSGIMAKYGARYLTTLGKVAHYTDVAYVPIPIEDHRNSVVIGLSASGETLTMIDRITGYKELGAKVVTITNGRENSFCKLADHALHYDIPQSEFIVMGPKKVAFRINTTSQVPVVYLIETLVNRCIEETRHLT